MGPVGKCYAFTDRVLNIAMTSLIALPVDSTEYIQSFGQLEVAHDERYASSLAKSRALFHALTIRAMQIRPSCTNIFFIHYCAVLYPTFPLPLSISSKVRYWGEGQEVFLSPTTLKGMKTNIYLCVFRNNAMQANTNQW